jgi:hypothetical protein
MNEPLLIHIMKLEDRCESWSRHCADQERAIAALHEALEHAHKTIEWLRFARSDMSDPPQGEPTTADADKRGRGAADPIIDRAIDRLNERVVSQPDRGKLRDALDKADAPLTGRAASNEALGRITKR